MQKSREKEFPDNFQVPEKLSSILNSRNNTLFLQNSYIHEDVSQSTTSAIDSKTNHFPIYGEPDPNVPDGRCWKCPKSHCDKSYKQLSGVISHYQTFHENLPDSDINKYKCVYPACHGRPYQNSNGLAYHLIMVHGDGMDLPPITPYVKKQLLNPQNRPPKMFSCPHKCGKSYRNSNGLSYHLKASRCPQVLKEQYLKRLKTDSDVNPMGKSSGDEEDSG